ncbi:MAG: hypothetical protein ACP5J5_02535 [Dissulfurimicrobium sp.]
MGKGIALLLDGGSADLYSSLCAIELAKRVSSDIHAAALHIDESFLEIGGLESVPAPRRFSADPNESLKMVIRLGDYRGINIFSYAIDAGNEDSLIDFLIHTRVSCLVVGAVDSETSLKKEKWLGRLRRRLYQGGRWYFGSFWTLIARPWEDEVYKNMLEIMGSYKQKFN